MPMDATRINTKPHISVEVKTRNFHACLDDARYEELIMDVKFISDYFRYRGR